MRKRRHHYVPKFYLKPWSHHKQVFCLRAGAIKRVGLRDVGVEEDFYAVRDLTLDDIEFLKNAVVAASPERFRPLHLGLLRDFARVAFANRLLQLRPEMADEAKEEIRKVVSNLDENYHEAIEHDLQDAIDCMLTESVAFLTTCV